MQAKKEEVYGGKRLLVYAYVVAALVLLALASFLVVPRSGGSISSCESLFFQDSRSACFANLAIANLNASICGYSQGTYADTCYLQIAQKTDQSALCGNVKDGYAMNNCVTAIAMAESNYALCYSASEPRASRCAENVALKLNNQTLCTSIKNLTDSQVCVSILGIRSALATSSPVYCKNVTASLDKSVTSYVIANTSGTANLNAYSVSGFASGELVLLPNVTYTARDFCYTTMAMRLLNSGLCANVSAGRARDLCTAESTTSLATNATVNYTTLLRACANTGVYAQQCTQAVMLYEAVKTRNASICQQLSSAYSASCYSSLATAYKNATYCSYISDPTLRSNCISKA